MPSAGPRVGVWQSAQPAVAKSRLPAAAAGAADVRSTGCGSEATKAVSWSHCA